MTLENENQPKVSVIIPVYNVKKYLPEALDSVLSQTYKNLEIILIDDGSDDGSELICDEYAAKDERIKLIHQGNGGLSAARNTGLDNMSGEYVAFLDSDDKFLPETIEKSMDALLSNDVDCVVFKRALCRSLKNGKTALIKGERILPVALQGKYSHNEALRAVADRKINAAVWNKVSKKVIWDNLRFPVNHVYEDIYTIFSVISKAEKVYVLDEVLILYRIRKEGINAGISAKNLYDVLDSWSVFENFIITNTPQIFEEEQLFRIRKKIFVDLLLRYLKFLSVNFYDETGVLSCLRNKIIELENFIKIKNFTFKIRLLYHFALNHPIILSVCYLPLYEMYRTVIKLIGIISK